MRIPLRPKFVQIPRLPKDFSAEQFRNDHFTLGQPSSFPYGYFGCIPAIQSWFVASTQDGSPAAMRLNENYLKPHEDTIVEMELTEHAPDAGNSTFKHFPGPLSLFVKWQAEHRTAASQSRYEQTLYISQSSLADLPPPLQADLPVPDIVRKAGRGDVYNSSIWMGVPPTRTPLHRDPNPNLFVQLAGEKIIRMIKPADGDRLFEMARKRLVSAGLTVGGGGRIRSEHMMVGEENQMLEDWAWGEADQGLDDPEGGISGFEIKVETGDGVFIPKGWWHTVRGAGTGINASVSNSWETFWSNAVL
jgi:Cupin-like domain